MMNCLLCVYGPFPLPISSDMSRLHGVDASVSLETLTLRSQSDGISSYVTKKTIHVLEALKLRLGITVSLCLSRFGTQVFV